MGAELRRSVYEMKLRRLDARMLGLGMAAPGAGGGSEGRLMGEDVKTEVSLEMDFGEPVDDAAAAAAPGVSSEMVFTAGGEALLAGLGARELLNGLATPEWNPEADAAPLTDALALTRPLMPIPCRRRDIVGGDGLPPDVPDADPSDPIPPGPVVVGWANVALSGDICG